MMPRIVLVFSRLALLALLSSALITGLACGKYGKPVRISPENSPVSASAGGADSADSSGNADSAGRADSAEVAESAQPDRDEDRKSRKP